MGPISLEITIDAPRERVFDSICDLGRRSAWADHFLGDYRLERLQAAGEGAGARFQVGAPGGIGYMDTVITSVRRPHRIDEQGRGGRFNRVPIRAVWELEDGEGAPTELRLSFWTEPPDLMHRLRELRAGGWWRRRWRKALRRLRDQLESGEGPPEPVGLAGGDRQPVVR